MIVTNKGSKVYPVDAVSMARTCRALASDLRREAAAEHAPVPMQSNGKRRIVMPRAEAAVSMDAQAARWEAEAAGGPRNVLDRARIGVP
jgi:hypothetical protein